MRWTVAVGIAVATLVLTGGAPATALLPAQRVALKAVAQARAANHLDSAATAAARREISRSAKLIRNLPASRARPLAQSLAQVAALDGRLTAPRAAAVIGQLTENDNWFARRGPPADKTDVTDADGVVYRYFAGKCFEFHPLANFGALNADVAAGNTDASSRLATALAARAVPEPGGGLAWEYYFNFGSGRAPWVSGMAQAVAAQAFAAAAGADPSLLNTAGRAYRAIAGRHLLTRVAAGPWIRLYSFSSLVVLNAQLQTVISLQSYAHVSGSAAAATLAARMQAAAVETLPRFDTGYWSDYSLAGDPSPVDYQQYVTQLLRKLAPADPRFAAAAVRFNDYLTEPPAFKLSNAAVGSARFWLSKPANVSAQSPAGPTRSLSLDPGWHTVTWKLPALSGFYPVHLTARDWAGNTAAIDALPIVRAAGISGTSAPAGPATAPPAPVTQPSFMVGAGLDVPAQGALARQLGLGTVQLGVAWPAGAAAPDPGLIQALQRVPAGTRVVVALIATPLPADDPGRAALAAYAVSLAQQVPAIRDIVLSPAVTVATAPAYVSALQALRAAIQAAVPAVAIGALLDGAQAPKASLGALAGTAGATGQTVLDLVAFRPAPVVATDAWTIADLKTLETTLTQSFTTAPPLLIDGLAAPTLIPPAKAGAYSTPPAPGGLAEAEQSSTYAATITGSSCDPAVAGVILDRLVDAATGAPTSGLYYADSTPKASAAGVGAAAVVAQRGSLVCPGFQAAAGASSVVFPTAVANGTTTPVQLGCTRDCLYLMTLERADGIPVVARRGALTGGAAAKTISLPKAQLAPGAYQVAVRLVTQTNPGPVTLLVSQPLTVA